MTGIIKGPVWSQCQYFHNIGMITGPRRVCAEESITIFVLKKSRRTCCVGCRTAARMAAAVSTLRRL
jgi:hypothetical protein